MISPFQLIDLGLSLTFSFYAGRLMKLIESELNHGVWWDWIDPKAVQFQQILQLPAQIIIPYQMPIGFIQKFTSYAPPLTWYLGRVCGPQLPVPSPRWAASSRTYIVSFDGWSSSERAWRLLKIWQSSQRDTVKCGNFPEETGIMPVLPDITSSIFCAAVCGHLVRTTTALGFT